MKSQSLKVLKIGGSLFSDKRRPYSLRLSRLVEIGGEIAEALKRTGSSLVIVHGGGSYGHYVASLHLKEKGRYDGEAFSLIADTMLELSLTISDALRSSGLRTAVYSTHALWSKEGLNTAPLTYALRLGVIPVLYGDIVIDESEAKIVSGDILVRDAAIRLGAEAAYFASDVDGIYDRPPSEPGARLIKAICPREAEALASGFSEDKAPVDVTGGIALKLRVMAEMASRGVKAIFFNGLKRGSFYMALTNTLQQYSMVAPCRNGW